VWTVALDTISHALWPRLDGLLDAAERGRAERFPFGRDRRQYQAAHAVKRLMLTAATGDDVAPEAWAFEKGVHGKPRVPRGAGPWFNLFHCDGLVTLRLQPVRRTRYRRGKPGAARPQVGARYILAPAWRTVAREVAVEVTPVRLEKSAQQWQCVSVKGTGCKSRRRKHRLL